MTRLSRLVAMRKELEEELKAVPEFEEWKTITAAIARLEEIEQLGKDRKGISRRGEASRRRKEAADACAAHLAGKTEALLTRQLHEYLDGKGLPLENQDPVSALHALLRQDKRFASHERGSWLLADARPRPSEVKTNTPDVDTERSSSDQG